MINPQFEEAYPFAESLARVVIGDRWGFIDKTGKFAINPQFDQAESFVNGLARVRISRRIGYVNLDGKYVWNPTK